MHSPAVVQTYNTSYVICSSTACSVLTQQGGKWHTCNMAARRWRPQQQQLREGCRETTNAHNSFSGENIVDSFNQAKRALHAAEHCLAPNSSASVQPRTPAHTLTYCSYVIIISFTLFVLVYCTLLQTDFRSISPTIPVVLNAPMMACAVKVAFKRTKLFVKLVSIQFSWALMLYPLHIRVLLSRCFQVSSGF